MKMAILQRESPAPEDHHLVPLRTYSSPSRVMLAQMLVAAENPVIVTSRSARTPAGLKLLVELAETLQAGVIDQQRRMNFPTRHPLNQSAQSRNLIAGADVVLGLEVADFWGVLNSFRDQVERTSHQTIKAGARVITIRMSEYTLALVASLGTCVTSV